MRTLGFVAVEFNQASGQPSIIGGDVYRDREEAQDIADREHTKTVQVGRRERYAVATVEMEDEDEL